MLTYKQELIEINKLIKKSKKSGNKPDFSKYSPKAQQFAEQKWNVDRSWLAATAVEEEPSEKEFKLAKSRIITALSRGAEEPNFSYLSEEIQEKAHEYWKESFQETDPMEQEFRRAKSRINQALCQGYGEPNFSYLSEEIQKKAHEYWKERFQERDPMEQEFRRAKNRIQTALRIGNREPNFSDLSEEIQEKAHEYWKTQLNQKKDLDIIAQELESMLDSEKVTPIPTPAPVSSEFSFFKAAPSTSKHEQEAVTGKKRKASDEPYEETGLDPKKTKLSDDLIATDQSSPSW